MRGRRLEVLQAQHDRMYRRGGHAPARWAVLLVAMACGLVPMALLIPLEHHQALHVPPHQQHLRIITDMGIPVAISLTYLSTRWWAAPIHRRQALLVALITAATVVFAFYGITGIDDQMEPRWVLWHFADISAWVIAAVAMTGGRGWQPPCVKPRLPSVDIVDLGHRDLQPDGQAAHYIRSPSYQRSSGRPATGRVA